MSDKIGSALKFIVTIVVIGGATILASKLGIPVPDFDDRCIYDYMG